MPFLVTLVFPSLLLTYVMCRCQVTTGLVPFLCAPLWARVGEVSSSEIHQIDMMKGKGYDDMMKGKGYDDMMKGKGKGGYNGQPSYNQRK